MGVGGENLGFFFGFLGVILVFGLKMGIFGVGIGHLVFGKNGTKEHKCIRHKELERKRWFLKMFDFVHFCALFGQESGENVRETVLFVRFCAPFDSRLKTRKKSQGGKLEKMKVFFH